MIPEADFKLTTPFDLTIPWTIAPRLSLKIELAGSTTLATRDAGGSSYAIASGGLRLGWMF